ncbi:MAG: HNH endonuclease [Candidatus Saccharibacteria bacterium]|nr:HNH endonuclease [Candidatus Saccharibacteria bacterium]
MSLTIAGITSITKHISGRGYAINFPDGRVIHLHKRRTIPALLTLIKFGEGCETDLTRNSTNLADLKEALRGKMSEDFFQDSYSDANKPFSELWNEEGFTFITNPHGQSRLGSKKYVLDPNDHEKLFLAGKKAERKPPTATHQEVLMQRQDSCCNLCNSKLRVGAGISPNSFSRDRIRLVWDHRIPVEKGGDSLAGNYQALCFYCNKCKWQVCNFCTLPADSCFNCALAFPEETSIIAPTQENIGDRAPHYPHASLLESSD